MTAVRDRSSAAWVDRADLVDPMVREDPAVRAALKARLVLVARVAADAAEPGGVDLVVDRVEAADSAVGAEVRVGLALNADKAVPADLPGSSAIAKVADAKVSAVVRRSLCRIPHSTRGRIR